ncbi:branched-chain amino acid ABC transporter permease [bacterium]|nr:branched-chain amino acid ABC transporter permease [bacterium]
MRLRPGLVGTYRKDAAIFRSGVQRMWVGVLLLSAIYLGFGGSIWFLRFEGEMMILAVTALFASIGAIGLNIVTGFAGQISLGHAFFLGIGAFTAALLGGVEESREVLDIASGQMVTKTILHGLGLDLIIWLPAAGLVAAFFGLIIAPVATRLRGLYLAFVTLGLVFVGEHVFREAKTITGGVGVGRPTAQASLFGFSFDEEGDVLGIFMDSRQRYYFLGLALLIVLGLTAKNMARSRIGRALAAVRDRDIAAEIMGIPLARYKTIAFVVSSFYAGVAGALLYSVIGQVQPESFNLLLSIEYIAMVLIGGVATISGSIMGAFFIVFLPRLVEEVAHLPLFGWISTSPSGGFMTVSQVEQILFGLFIIGFLILEPLGLYGIWIRIRNYWKAFPFSY